MIEYQSGNLLEADVEALVNAVNCVGVMGKGIALQFRYRFVDNFHVYKRACSAGEVQIGKCLVVPTNELYNPRIIVNFPTKYHWRDKSKLENISRGLDALVEVIQGNGIKSIAIPALGCGNGGLNWQDVRQLIEQSVERIPTVHVLVYPPGKIPKAESKSVAI